MNNILILITFLTLCSCNSQTQENNSNTDKITISGTVGYPLQAGQITLEKFDGNQPVAIDTIELNKEDYSYSTELAIETPGYYRLNFYNTQFVPLILHRDDVKVNVDGNARGGFVSIKGSRDHDFIENAQQLYAEFQSSEEVQKINQAFTQARAAQDEETMDSLRKVFLAKDEEIKQELISMIDTMEASLGVIEILNNARILDKDKHYQVYKDYAEVVKDQIPDSEIAQRFVNEVEQMGKLAIGQVAPDIALPNPEGDTVSLSSLRGKYVLVDFWAKWCKPCRMENPNVVRVYNKYNNKGFEVYGVSLDRRREDWLQAIEEDGLVWTQVSDLKFWNSKAAEIYNIKAIPFAVLLDPNGVIIAKNLRGQALDDKLEEIFKDKN